MTTDLDPVPSGQVRHDMADRVRIRAASISRMRTAARTQKNNGEAKAALAMKTEWTSAFGTFSKGLEHDNFGRVKTEHLRTLISEINQDKPGSASGETPLPGTYASGISAPFNVPKVTGKTWTWPAHGPDARNWESPLAGHTLEIDGPDPDQLAMPPAPGLTDEFNAAELTAEIAEIYAMALIRDIPFALWIADPKDYLGAEQVRVQDARDRIDAVIAALNSLSFFKNENGLDVRSKRRRAARFIGGSALTRETIFRGSTRGAQNGPYLSQFLLIGNAEKTSIPDKNLPDTESATESVAGDAFTRSQNLIPSRLRPKPADGIEAGGMDTRSAGVIQYGPQSIPQTIVPHRPGRDHMTDLRSWKDVQDGANRKGYDYYLRDTAEMPVSRFLTTPRDMATYVHFDALYQAYLNACLILLGEGAAVDAGLPEGPFLQMGQGHDTRDGFALFGGPHILTLLCECATRALKAVRRQKYNIHLRSRPEAIASALTLAWNTPGAPELGHRAAGLVAMKDALVASGLPGMISTHNAKQNAIWTADGWPVDLGWIADDKNALLPMAFPEGSPMHPSYGAGHATVAGACVTMLKAFFEMYAVTNGAAFAGNTVKRGKLDLKAIMGAQNGYPGVYQASLFGAERTLADLGHTAAYQADPAPAHDVGDKEVGAMLKAQDLGGLTIQGELDKLAANIAIARDFAGVHFYTDYYESLRMGERIAVGMLQEQMLTYREPVTMRLTSFDDDRIMIVGTGGSRDFDDTPVYVWDKNGQGGDLAAYKNWWKRAEEV